MANGFFVIPIEHAAAVVTALLNVFTYGVVLGAFQKEMGERAALWIPFGAIVLCIMEGFCVPWYNKEIYRGQIGINIWHNPTNLCVRPFTLLAFLQIRSILADYGDNRKTSPGKWICTAVLMCVCNLAKPSCAQIIIPAVGMLCIGLLRKDFKKSLVFSLKMMAAMLLCVLLMVLQYVVSFYVSGTSDGGVEIAWLDVWKQWSPNVLVSLFLSMLFPVYYYIMQAGKHRHFGTEDKLALCILFSGLAEYSIFAEAGERRYHGNFGWGLQLAAFLTYFVCVKNFYMLNFDYDYDTGWERRKILAGWIILFLQFSFGIYYIVHLLTTAGKFF